LGKPKLYIETTIFRWPYNQPSPQDQTGTKLKQDAVRFWEAIVKKKWHK